MANGISVVIPVFNGASHLSECVLSALHQTVRPDTIIIVDDGSDDATRDIARSFGGAVRYVWQAHAGAASARNTGLKAVETEYVALLDGDDIWERDKLESQLTVMARADNPTMCFGHVQQFISPELSAIERAALRFDAAPLPGWCASALLIRNRDFLQAGPFDETLEMGEFAEWLARARDCGIAALLLPQVVVRRRLHRTNLGRTAAGNRADYAKALKKVLDRRRRTS
jgi:glycosyltransferase involved in cell wall biosynthesis